MSCAETEGFEENILRNLFNGMAIKPETKGNLNVSIIGDLVCTFLKHDL